MEQSATKRRKLSPSTSVPATASNTNSRPITRDGIPSSGHRASFASPTKASLARFNPGLLTAVRSSDPRRRTTAGGSSVGNPTFDINSENKSSGRPTSGGPRTDKEISAGSTGEENAEGNGGTTRRNGLSASPRRRSKTPTIQYTPSKLPQIQPTPSLRALPSRTTDTKPPIEGNSGAAEGDRPPNGIIIDESAMAKLPHTPTHRGVPQGTGQIVSSEPSLPPTPSQLGIEMPSQRPKGLLFGRTHKGTTKKDKRLSPSKEKEAAEKQSPGERPTISALGPKIFLPDLPKPAPTVEQANLQKKTGQRTKMESEVLASMSSHMKDVLLTSWQSPGGKETMGQQRQRKKISNLSSKLLQMREDINHRRSLIDGAGDVSHDQAAQSASAESGEPSGLDSLSLPQMLSQFIPFSGVSNPARIDATPNSGPLDSSETVNIRDSVSLDDNLDHPEALLQNHTAEFNLNGTTLLALRITIDTETFEIHDLKLLEQGSFSSQELRTWTRTNIHPKQLASIGTAIKRCSYVTERRAACWRSCHERHPELITTPLPDDSTISSQQTITFQRHDLLLSIKWAIRLREDGEAESKLSIAVDLPPAWVDEGIVSASEAQGVREAFDLLVRERGVTEGIAAVVKVVFQSED